MINIKIIWKVWNNWRSVVIHEDEDDLGLGGLDKGCY